MQQNYSIQKSGELITRISILVGYFFRRLNLNFFSDTFFQKLFFVALSSRFCATEIPIVSTSVTKLIVSLITPNSNSGSYKRIITLYLNKYILLTNIKFFKLC